VLKGTSWLAMTRSLVSAQYLNNYQVLQLGRVFIDKTAARV